MKRFSLSVVLVLALSVFLTASVCRAADEAATPGGYAVVVSKATYDDADWKSVVEALAKKHGAEVIVYEEDVKKSVEALRKQFPRYACFVARPEEAKREFIVEVHRLTRALDDDPYTDLLWGVLTGYSAEAAMKIVETDEPLEITKGASGTGLPMGVFREAMRFSEGEAGACWVKTPDGTEEKKTCPDDSTKSLVDMFNDFQPQFFLTSGHATDRDWQIGYSYKNGQFRCKDGVLVGIDLERNVYPIQSPNAKVYLASGNCLAGLIRDRDSMALAWMNSAGVRQLVGYVVSTWYGRGGWGVRDYFFDLPGRYNLAESFYFNNQTLVYDLGKKFPKSASIGLNQWNIESDPMIIGKVAAALGYREWNDDVKDNIGLLWDRDTVAFYGDPAWDARLAPREVPIQTRLDADGDTYTLEVTASEAARPGRPLAVLLPDRVKNVEIVEGAEEFEPLVTDNFIMLMKQFELEKGKTYRVVFKAEKMD